MNGRWIEWGAAMRTLGGERASGDRYLVEEHDGRALLAVIDGVGHGEEAALAAAAGATVLQRHAGEPVDTLLRRCHEALRDTRGAAMSLATIEGGSGTMRWSGIGNVEGVVVRGATQAPARHEYLTVRGGLLGRAMPSPFAASVALGAGDLVILATDGVRPGFAPRAVPDDSPRRIAERILAQNAGDRDDALVLVARYAGGAR